MRLALLQNAWNLPVLINPTLIAGDPARSGQFCGTPICQEGDVSSFCQSPNSQTGYPGYGCYNVDGPNVNSPTTGTQMFKNNCQSSYSYATDNTNTVFACPTNSAYEIVFCPWGSKLLRKRTPVLLVPTRVNASSLALYWSWLKVFVSIGRWAL